VPPSLQQFKAQLFRALANEVRIRLLEELRDGERSVGELQERVGVSGPNVSQHLAVLRSHGIVAARRDGASVIYSIVDPRLHNLLDDARAIFEHQIAVGTALLKQRGRSR
jgi:DNA-binding transcriptional ArsR family regulator